MLLENIQTIRTPRFSRDPRVKWTEKTWGKACSLLDKNDFMKVVTTGAAVIAVLSCMILFTAHQNEKFTNIESRMRETELEWKRKASLLQLRSKREALKVDHIAEEINNHNIVRRAAQISIQVDEEQENQIAPVGGSVYTRWGRSDCPTIGPSRLIYSGVTAGTYFSHTGGGANYMCLHANVSYDETHFKDGFAGSSHVYGTEWRDTAWVNSLFDLTDTMGRSIQYHSVPCALCLAEKRYGHVMIPGRHECPEHWIFEYDGYIMANGHSDKHSTEFICVDRRPQLSPGTQGAQNGAYLWIVETQCASLHCEPVVAGREIRCVVCTI